MHIADTHYTDRQRHTERKRKWMETEKESQTIERQTDKGSLITQVLDFCSIYGFILTLYSRV